MFREKTGEHSKRWLNNRSKINHVQLHFMSVNKLNFCEFILSNIGNQYLQGKSYEARE